MKNSLRFTVKKKNQRKLWNQIKMDFQRWPSTIFVAVKTIEIAAEDSQDTTVRQSCINQQVLTHLQWDCTQAKIRTAAFFCSVLYKRFYRYLRKQPSLQTIKMKSWLCSLVLMFSCIISFRFWMSRKVFLDRGLCKQVCDSESRIHIRLMFTHCAVSLQQQLWQRTTINEKGQYGYTV